MERGCHLPRAARSGRAPLPASRAGQGTDPAASARVPSPAAREAPRPPPRPLATGRLGAPGAEGPQWHPERAARGGTGGRRRWRPGAGDHYLLSGTARGSAARRSSRARPLRVPRAPSGAASRSANAADVPEVAQRGSGRRISAPPGAAAAAARSRPPSAAAALRRDWSRHSGRRRVAARAGEEGRAGGAGRGGGGEVSTGAPATAAAAPAARPPSRAAGRRGAAAAAP